MINQSVFFSYSRKDSDFVLKLAKQLRESGANVWLDQLDIKPGTNWDDSIEAALQASDVMLVILSKTSVESQNVRDEYSYAIEEKKRVVPVLLEPCTIPFRLRRLQYADFTSDETIGLNTLYETLNLTDQSRGSVLPHEVPDAENKTTKKIHIERPKPMQAARIIKWSFGLLLFIVLLWLSNEYILNKFESTAQITVLVHDESGKDQLVLPGRGVVTLIFGDAIIEETINSKGEATFKQIPTHFFDDDVTVEILFSDPQGEPYRSLQPDSAYSLKKGEYIALPVLLEGLDNVYGIIRDFKTGNPIEGARISILGSETFTDQYGEYKLEIPKEIQQKFQTVRVYKEGYELYEQQNIPIQTKQELSISLKPVD